MRSLDRPSVEIRDVTRANYCGTDGPSNREISCVQEQFLWLLCSRKAMVSYALWKLYPEVNESLGAVPNLARD